MQAMPATQIRDVVARALLFQHEASSLLGATRRTIAEKEESARALHHSSEDSVESLEGRLNDMQLSSYLYNRIAILEASVLWALGLIVLADHREASGAMSFLSDLSCDLDSSERRLSAIRERLLSAVKEGNVEELRRLLDDGADPNFPIAANGMPPLMIAAFYGHVACASLLLQRGADVNASLCGRRCTALHYACCDPRGRCVPLLLNAGATVDYGDRFGRSPLFWAAILDNEAVVRVLLAAGASKMHEDHHGESAFDYSSTDTIRDLLAR